MIDSYNSDQSLWRNEPNDFLIQPDGSYIKLDQKDLERPDDLERAMSNGLPPSESYFYYMAPG